MASFCKLIHGMTLVLSIQALDTGDYRRHHKNQLPVRKINLKTSEYKLSHQT